LTTTTELDTTQGRRGTPQCRSAPSRTHRNDRVIFCGPPTVLTAERLPGNGESPSRRMCGHGWRIVLRTPCLAQMRPVMVRVSATSHGTPCDQSQSRAGSDSVPSAIRTTAHQCRHAAVPDRAGPSYMRQRRTPSVETPSPG